MSKTFFPSINFTLPFSRMSKAIALARLVEVEFKLTLYAIRKSLAEIAVTPECFIFSLYFIGPKSGFQLASDNFFSKPSYSPDLTVAKFFLSSLVAAFS